jgi:large subunit ribosomal protein L10
VKHEGALTEAPILNAAFAAQVSANDSSVVDLFIYQHTRKSIDMAISREKKSAILTKLDAGLKDASTVAFVRFDKLTVKEADELRKKLREQGVSYYVAKKTLVKRALNAHGYEGEMPEMEGELALAWSKDQIAPAKGLYEFAKTHKEQVMFLGGIFDGKYVSKQAITEIASIPSREGLYGQVVGILNASIANVVRAIDAKAKQMEGAAA